MGVRMNKEELSKLMFLGNFEGSPDDLSYCHICLDKGYILYQKLKNDFRRLNNSLKNIEFVLYDELLQVFQNIIKRISKDS